MMPFTYYNSLVDAEMVNVWRFDVDARVQNGIKTARTFLAEATGNLAMYGFFDDDIICHTSSNYEKRLEAPSRTPAGIGSPFISASLNPNDLFLNYLIVRDDANKSGLYKITVPTNRVIIPKVLDIYENFDEVLIVGDVESHQITRVCGVMDLKNFSLSGFRQYRS